MVVNILLSILGWCQGRKTKLGCFNSWAIKLFIVVKHVAMDEQDVVDFGKSKSMHYLSYWPLVFAPYGSYLAITFTWTK